MEQVGIVEAARRLGISQDTVRRRLKIEELKGTKVTSPGGFRWVVDLDGQGSSSQTDDQQVDHELVDLLKAQVQDLRDQLETRAREVSELHQLLAVRALNPSKSWWRFWK